jgi:serine/threonine protein phosphatase PrpC
VLRSRRDAKGPLEKIATTTEFSPYTSESRDAHRRTLQNMIPYTLCLAGNPEVQDRVQTFSLRDWLIIAIADGAGGISGGAQAAESLIRIAAEQKSSLLNADDCVRLLREADQRIASDPRAGETTGIVLIIKPNEICGASVGDSEAWILSPNSNQSLTRNQIRKPFLGSRASIPIAFTFSQSRGILLVATDGLWKYTSNERIIAEMERGEHSTLPERLANLVRLQSGALQDDLALAAVSLDFRQPPLKSGL